MNIFFDLDGTLIDVSDRNYSVYKKIILKLKGKPLQKDVYWSHKRNKTDISEILTLSKISKDKHALYKQKFLNNIESKDSLVRDQLFPFTLSTLDELLQGRHTLYLISYRQFKNKALEQIKKLGLNKKFKDIKVGRIDKSGVESKLKFIELIRKSSAYFKSETTPEIIVGDTEDEILTAQKLKLVSIGVLSGIRNKKGLKKLQPNFIIKDVSLLPSLILQGI